MRRALASCLVVLAVILPAAVGAQAANPTRSAQWRAVAEHAMDRLEQMDGGGTQRAWTLAYAAQVEAWRSPLGWMDPVALLYLDRLHQTQNPDGGYGLGFAYDAHGDGTVNPATTTYTITMAGQVGPVLLDAYLAGVVPAAEVQQVVDLLLSTPRIDTSAGRCFAYSRDLDDAKPGLCVHNVNASVGWFLTEAARAGFVVPWLTIQLIDRRLLSAYNASTRYWPYRDNMAPAPQDADHNAMTVEYAYPLAHPVGYSAAVVMMGAPLDGDPDTPQVYMRLTGLPPAPTEVVDGVSVWCELGDQWIDEADAFVDATTEIHKVASAAYLSMRASRACA